MAALGIQLVSEPNNLKLVGAAFGPDERYVWFAERRSNWTYNAQLPQYQLAIYDRETGERHERTSRYGSAFRPTLSPTVNGWCMEPDTTKKRDYAYASLPPATNVGLCTPYNGMIRSRLRS